MNLREAIPYAATLHAGQVDKAGEPYIDHCLRVAELLPDDASDDERIAAVLHDTIEDCGATVDDLLRAGVPPEAVKLVEILTRRPRQSYADFIARIARSGESAIKVKLADIADNADPRRLAQLDSVTARRLVDKYARAVGALRQPRSGPTDAAFQPGALST